jgi:hypothetical protein
MPNYAYMRPIIIGLLAATSTVMATPSGLNNIPTADTTPQGTFVLQGFTTIGNDRDADFNLGFKTGIDAKWVKLELGASSHISPGKGGPITPHGKLAIPFGEGLPTLAVGVANLSFTNHGRDRAGDEFFYAVVSHDFGWFRLHGGCASQDRDALPFYGIDKTFRKIVRETKASDGKSVSGKEVVETSRDLFTLRADAIQQANSDWLYSAGILVPVFKHFVFETWGNFPDNGADPSLTIKGNFVFTF